MSRFWKIAGVVTLVALMGAVGVVGVVLAQEPTPPKPIAWMRGHLAGLRDAIASKLGIDTGKLDAAVQESYQEMIEQAVTDGKITQEQADRMLSHTEDGFWPGGMGPRGARVGRFGRHMEGFAVRKMGGMEEVFAERLGMTADELKEELQAGKTLAEIAEAKGVDLEEIRQSRRADTETIEARKAERADTETIEARKAETIEARKAAIEKAVEDGTMTQAEAEWLLQGLEQGFMPMGRGFYPGRGGHFGFVRPAAP